MNKAKLSQIFEILKEQDPEPITELNYTTDFELLVAIVLSAQATDVSVNKATEKLYKVANTPEQILKLGEEGLKKYIKTIGLFNSKAKNIVKLCEALLEKHEGKVPDSFEELHALAGVGEKTANVFLNCFHKVPVIAVDTHVFRVSNRLGICNTKTASETQAVLNKKVPKEYKLHAHHWLILHGRYTCIARKPKCDECRLTGLCKFYKKASK